MIQVTLSSGVKLSINTGDYEGNLTTLQAVINRAVVNEYVKFSPTINPTTKRAEPFGTLSSRTTLHEIKVVNPNQVTLKQILTLCMLTQTDLDNAILLPSGTVLTLNKDTYHGDLKSAIKDIQAFISDKTNAINYMNTDNASYYGTDEGYLHINNNSWYVCGTYAITIEDMLRYCGLADKRTLQTAPGKTLTINKGSYAGDFEKALSFFRDIASENDVFPVMSTESSFLTTWYRRLAAHFTPTYFSNLPDSVEVTYLLEMLGISEEEFNALLLKKDQEEANYRALEAKMAEGVLNAQIEKDKKLMEEKCILIKDVIDNFADKIAAPENLKLGLHHAEALKVAYELKDQLYSGLEELKGQSDREYLKSFIDTSVRAIKRAKPILEKDLGWGTYLINMIKELLNTITMFVSQSSFFTPVQPRSVEIVNELTSDLDLIKYRLTTSAV